MAAAMKPSGDFKPIPDPTSLTTQQLQREIATTREIVEANLYAVKSILETRLEAIDRATRLFQESADKLPDVIDEKVGHLQGLQDQKFQVQEERFSSVATQFKERDTRSEREARDNKVAVDAAFAAQKEAAAKQDETNLKAIDKSEKATAETITKLSELFKSTTDALGDKIDDLKQRLTLIEGQRVGNPSMELVQQRLNQAEGQKKGGTEMWGYLIGLAGIVLAAIALALKVRP